MEAANVGNVPNKRWWHIIFVAFLLYTIAFMDRTNVGFGFAGMQKELGFSPTISGLVGSIFFIGYFILQIPGGIWATKWSIKKLISILIVCWGILAMATGFVHSASQLLVVRFLLGVAEGAIYPALMVLISRWFPATERGRATSLFILCIPFGAMIMSPISMVILAHSTWRLMFIIEGAIPFVWLIFWWLLIEDRPQDAKWLSKEELNYLETEFAKEKQESKSQVYNFKEAFKNRNIILLLFIYFFIQIGQNSIAIWLPTVVKSLSQNNYTLTTVFTALPWLAGIVGLVIMGWHSDKTMERKNHVTFSLIVGGLLLLTSTLIGKTNPIVGLVILIFAVGVFQSYNGNVWAIPPEVVDLKMVGPIAGLINGVGCLGGGFAGPLVVGALLTKTHSTVAGQLFLVASLIIAGILVQCLNYKTIKDS